VIRRLLFKLTPKRLRCRLFGHTGKVYELTGLDEVAGTYEEIDMTECGRCGKKFTIVHHETTEEAEFNAAFAKAHSAGTVRRQIEGWFEKDRPSPVQKSEGG